MYVHMCIYIYMCVYLRKSRDIEVKWDFQDLIFEKSRHQHSNNQYFKNWKFQDFKKSRCWNIVKNSRIQEITTSRRQGWNIFGNEDFKIFKNSSLEDCQDFKNAENPVNNSRFQEIKTSRFQGWNNFKIQDFKNSLKRDFIKILIISSRFQRSQGWGLRIRGQSLPTVGTGSVMSSPYREGFQKN